MDYKVILAKTALRDLGNIARWIAQDNPRAAENVGTELLDLAESLRTMPNRGAKVRARPGVFKLVRAPYLVVYRVDEAKHLVSVQRFWHGHQNPNLLLA